MYREEEEEDFA